MKKAEFIGEMDDVEIDFFSGYIAVKTNLFVTDITATDIQTLQHMTVIGPGREGKKNVRITIEEV